MRPNIRNGLLSLLAISISMGITSCKKEASPSQKPNEAEPTGISATYSPEHYQTVQKLIRQGKDHNSFGSIPGWSMIQPPAMPGKSNASHRTTEGESEAFTEYDQDDEYPHYYWGNEGDNYYYWGGFYEAEDVLFSGFNDITFDWEPTMYSAAYGYVPRPHNMYIYKVLHFTRRDVYMQVGLHVLYTRTKGPNGGIKYTYAPVYDGANGFDVTGTKMGEVDETQEFFTFSLAKTGEGEFHGNNITEKRSIIYSVEGSMKVSSNVNLGAFQAGIELGAGFTISNATHTYTHYSAEGTINFESEGYNAVPMYQVNWTGRSFGIQKE